MQRSAGRARPPHRRVLETDDRAARSGDRRNPPAERVSAAPPFARAGVGGGRRCGGSGAEGGQAERDRLRQRGAPQRFRASASRCRSRPVPRIRTDRDAALDYFSITLSHPRWLAARWYDRMGFDATEAWLTFNNAPAPLTLRANTLRRLARGPCRPSRREGQSASGPARFAPDGFIVEEGQPLAGAGADAGWFVVQDEASQLVALLAGARPGPRVLDACASPGGKTTALAAAMRNAGLCSSRATCAPGAWSCCAGPSRERRHQRAARAGGSAGAVAVHAPIRLRARRCALLRPRHSAAGSRYPLAPTRERSRAAGGGTAADARSRGGSGRAGRTADLRDLFQRARRERSGRRRVPRRRAAVRRGRRAHRVREPSRRGRRSRAAICGRCRTTHGLEAFFGAVFERRR